MRVFSYLSYLSSLIITLLLIISPYSHIRTLATPNPDLGQHFIIGINHYPIQQTWLDFMQEHRVSGVVFVSDAYRKAAHVKQAIARISAAVTNPAFLFCIDQEGGRVNRIKDGFTGVPAARDIAEKNDRSYSSAQASLNASQLRELGIRVNFAPVVDVNRHPENSVIGDRSFSGNPLVVERESGIVIEEHLRHGVLPVIKHFPGHGQTHLDSHVTLPVHSNPDELELLDIRPFYSLIRSGAPAVMVGHVLYPSIDAQYPASLSSTWVRQILKTDMGFSGLVFSDDLGMGAVRQRYSLHQATRLALDAGIHQVIVIASLTELSSLFTALRQDLLRDSEFKLRLNQSSSRIHHLKQDFFNF